MLMYGKLTEATVKPATRADHGHRADKSCWRSWTQQGPNSSGDGFLLVFSITSMSSLRDLMELREDIIKMNNGDTHFPMVLVGNKSDLEEDRRVSRSRAFQLSQSWGDMPYYETSARKDANVSEVFIDVCRQIIRKEIERGRLQPNSKKPKDRKEDREDRRKRRREDESGSRCTIL
nr:ras-related protein rsr1 [Quercus suber]